MMSAKRRTFVAGVGMTKFEKPLSRAWDYPDMAEEAGRAALQDAGVDYKDIQAVAASYCYGEPTSGQRAVYTLGMTGVPVFNVNNNCSSGSTALLLARTLVQSGYDCVLAIGFEKMESGLSERYTDRTSPVDRHVKHMTEDLGAEPGIIRQGLNAMTSDVIKMFAYAAKEYLKKYVGNTSGRMVGSPLGATFEDLVKIAHKNRKQGVNNERASFQRELPMETIGSKGMLCYPITISMSAATADGGAAAIVCSKKFIESKHVSPKAVEIVAQHMVTDLPSTFGSSFMDLVGVSMAEKAAQRCYRESGLKPSDVDVLEVHDCFSCNELFMYEALGLAERGCGAELIRNSHWIKNNAGGEVCKLGTQGWVVNPSGGLESKGHPIGATGLAQCCELVWQLRGEAGKRQVDGARVAVQHNFGIGGAAVVTFYQKYGAAKTEAGLPTARL